jgi:hypothetical protein
MKKLYQWAGAYTISRYEIDEDNAKEVEASAKRDLDFLNSFLRYVWEHRNEDPK